MMIEIRQLTKRYRGDRVALQPMDLSIGTGMFGLLGPNGAGKTTLMRILATLLQPTSGHVYIDGISLHERPEKLRTRIGYLPQNFDLPQGMTGREFLEYIAVMRGIRHVADRKREVVYWLEALNLTGVSDLRIRSYSGGMKRRVGIAQALLGKSALLILDEPTSGLDPEERIRLRMLLAEHSRNRTILLSTHIVADIENSCRTVAVLDGGKLKHCGDVSKLQQLAANQVWELELSEQQMNRMEPWRIVTARKTDRAYRCRVINKTKPREDATVMVPTLEDGYLVLIGGRS